MLIPYATLKNEFGVDTDGVLHIGASTGQEAAAYYSNGIKRSIWVEAIPDVYDKLCVHLAQYPDAIPINACISDQDGQEKDFHISSNDGESSSLLEFAYHSIMHPDVTKVDTIQVITRRMDTILDQILRTDLTNYPFLNIDLQGSELAALKSLGGHLRKVQYAYIEVNQKEVYKDCCQVEEIDDYLAKFGLHRAFTKWVDNAWGDAIYLKS